MTEHSIEELERQWEAARGRKIEADKLLEAARFRLHDAKCEASGWMGEVVEYRGARFVVSDIEFMSKSTPWRLACKQIKKDGTPSMLNRYLYLGADKPAKLGKYVPPASPQPLSEEVK